MAHSHSVPRSLVAKRVSLQSVAYGLLAMIYAGMASVSVLVLASAR